MVAGAVLNVEAIAERLDRGYLDATTLMEYLIGRGLPQRTAHHLVGRLVGAAMEQGVPLAQLSLAEFQAEHAELDETIFEVLGARRAVEAFMSYGSTAPSEVARQVARWKQQLEI